MTTRHIIVDETERQRVQSIRNRQESYSFSSPNDERDEGVFYNRKQYEMAVKLLSNNLLFLIVLIYFF